MEKLYSSAAVASGIFGILGITLAYITGFHNKKGALSFNRQHPFITVSGAMHYCSKIVVVPILILSGLFSMIFYYNTQIKINGLLTCLMLGFTCSLMWFIANCDCFATHYDSCCPAAIAAGTCTVEKINKQFKDDILDQPVCCNGPSCTKEKNIYMNRRHMTIAIVITTLCIVIMMTNYIYICRHFSMKKRFSYITIVGLFFTFLIGVGISSLYNKQMMFGLLEALLIPTFYASIIVIGTR